MGRRADAMAAGGAVPRRLGAVPLALAAVLAASLAGMAGAAHSAMPGNSKAAYDIEADEAEYIDAENRAIWRGRVVAIQGDARLTTPLLNGYFARNPAGGQVSSGSIERMEADGPVYYVTEDQSARGDHATFLAANNTVTLTGQVVLMQGKNVMQGDRLVIDTVTSKATWAKSRNRVRGVFYPNDGNTPAAATPPRAPQPAAPTRR